MAIKAIKEISKQAQEGEIYMEYTREIIQLYNIEITILLLASFFVLLALYLIAEIRISKLKNRYDALARGTGQVNIEEILLKDGQDIDKLKDNICTIEDELNKLEKTLNFAVQRVGFTRYNAFADMGSELSFSIAFLDGFSNGFVLSSIYSRESTTSYAKPIKEGKSIYPLSAEEIQAVDRAIKNR